MQRQVLHRRRLIPEDLFPVRIIPSWELYELEKDPQELTSVYGEPAFAKITEALKKELSRLRKEYKVPEDTRPLPSKIRKLY